MLQTNFVVELGLFNGAVGTVKAIVYEDSDGPRRKGALPHFVVVDFPLVHLSPEDRWMANQPSWVPIPVVTLRCEKKCCSVSTIPLRVCKAITIYKSQGMTVGLNQIWRRLVVLLPSKTSQAGKTPGLAQVAFSRASELGRLAVLETPDCQLTVELLKSIGTTAPYKVRREFEATLRQRATETQPAALAYILQEDPADEKSLDGALQALCAWYRGEVARRAAS
jgi:hypothetical protein